MMDRLRSKLQPVGRFLNGPFFNPKYKGKMHFVQVFFVLILMGLTGARIIVKPKGVTMTRADTMGIAMGAKTLVFIAYQVLTTHVQRLQRWRSLKAYKIINIMEVVFWQAVTIFIFKAIRQYCSGTYCALSWITLLIAVILVHFAFWTAVVAWNMRRDEKNAQRAPEECEVDQSKTATSVESAV